MEQQSLRPRYDVVVIGSGLGGLTAGALLAKAGRSVLICEQHDRPGGYAQSFTRHGFQFDSAIHFTGGCFPMDHQRQGVILKTLDLLGVADNCEFIPLEPFYRIVAPDFEFDVPGSLDSLRDSLVALCPEETRGIDRLVRLCHGMDEQLRELPQCAAPLGLLTFPFRFPQVVRYGNWTLQQGLDRFLREPRLKTVLGSLCMCFATPVSRISFALWTHLVMGLVHEQACYCKGSFQQLAHAFVTGLQNHGGQIAYKRTVESIDVGNDAVRGVRLRDGHVVEADTVICNADMVGTYMRLLPAEYRPPGMLRKLQGMRETMGGFTVYVETDLDLTTTGLVHETAVLGDLDLETCFAGLENGKNTAFVLSAPSLSDPGLCPEGKHQIMIATFVPYDANLDRTAKDARKMQLLERAYAVVPELRGRVLYAEAGSPRTCERYTSNYRGAALGWEASPWQSGYKRPSPISPIKGLFHAGHWTRPGGGVYGTIVSGRNAAQFAMGYKDPAKFFRDLQNMN